MLPARMHSLDVKCFTVQISCTSLTSGSHLADSAMEAGLHMVFTLIARVDKAILALVVQLHQHAHGTPLGPPQ